MSYPDRPNDTPAAEHVLALARRLPAADQARLVRGLLDLPDPSDAGAWLTLAGAAAALHTTRSTVCRLVGRGQLVANGRGGHARRVSLASVLALVAEAAERAKARDARAAARRQWEERLRKAGSDPQRCRRPRF